GGGITLESVPSSVKEISVIELEPEVVRAHESLEGRRSHSPLSDPRIHMIVNDARGALQLTNARFDGIVSQPSHPWTAGASHLYTREFFSLVHDHLEPGGVFVQWIGIAFIRDAMLRSMVATLLDTFGHVALFRPADGAILFAASDAPIELLASASAALAASPTDFAHMGLRTLEDVAYAWVLDPARAAEFARDAPIISDDQNPLATRAAHLRHQSLSVTRCDEMLAPFEPLSAEDAGLDRIYLAHRLATDSSHERALRYAQATTDPVRRLVALGWAQ